MASIRASLLGLLYLGLSSCAAQTAVEHSRPVSLTSPQPTFPFISVEPPELTPPGPPAGNAILLEDRGRRGSAPKRAPVTISRTFARGEMSQCVEAVVAGLVVETQCDVKTRWPDGSLRHALVSFWMELDDRAHAQVDFLPAPCNSDAGALGKEQMLQFLDSKWDATVVLNASMDGSVPVEQRVRAQEMLSKWDGMESARGVRYWMKGPIATQVIVEDPEFDFGWEASLPQTTLRGNLTAQATSFTTTDTSGAVLSKWKFPLPVVIGREILQLCSSDGPVVHVCPNGRGAYGTAPTASSDGAPITPNQGWAVAKERKRKSLHPIFVLTFYPGWQGVKVETIMENVYLDRVQDQHYSIRLFLGTDAAAPVWERRGLTHYFSARWRKTFWYGQQPAALRIDHNLPYLIYSRVVPNYDTTIQLKQEAIIAELKKFHASDMGEPLGTALWQPFMSATGGRMDIGILPGWYVLYLYTWDPSMQDLVEAMAGVSGHVPIHLKESPDCQGMFDPYTESTAAGRVVSIDARPTFFTLQPAPYVRVETRREDAATQVGPLGRSGWSPDDAHQPSMAYLPYALTGDWYYLEEMHYWSSYNLTAVNPQDCNYCRFGPLGYLLSQPRGEAWVLRNLAHAVVMTPQDMPEYKYFYSKLQNNIAIREGFFNITDGHFYEPRPGCDAKCMESRWRIGRDILAWGGENPLQIMNYGNAGQRDEAIDPAKCSAAGSPWMNNFLHSTLGLIEELGFGEVTPLRRRMAKHFIGQLVHPDYNPYLVGIYRIPTRDKDGNLYTNWADVRDAYKPEFAGRTRFTDLALVCVDCYPDIARGTASWMVGIETDDGLSGSDAFVWIFKNLPNREGLRMNPIWAILPRIAPAGFRGDSAKMPNWYNPKLVVAAKSTR
jgi:hypothetical protein